MFIALVPVGAILVISYTATEKAMTSTVEGKLVAIADSRASQIETQLRERIRAVAVLSRQADVAASLLEFRDALETAGAASPVYALAERSHAPALARFADGAGFSNLMLIANNGRIVHSQRARADLGAILTEPPFAGSELARVFDRAKTLMGTEMSSFAQHPLTREPQVLVAAPVFDGGTVVGVVVAQLGTDDVARLISDTTGLGQTGETVVGSAMPDGVMVVVPLRHDPGGAFRRIVGSGSPDGMALLQAAHGTRGNGITTDYRGIPVVAAWRYLPSLAAGMVVKIDAAEALAPVRRQLDALLLLSGVVCVAALLVAVVLSRTIATPLRRLTAAARAVAGGNLQQHVPVTSNDEIGDFTITFNRMIADLRQTYVTIERTVVQRTEQLRQETETVRSLNRQLMESLSYASRIQRTLLPRADSLHGLVDEIAVCWEPRDVVGGDFYWWERTDDGFVIVLADCTGHGVPGAFVTIIVAGALDRLNRTETIRDPARFLAELHEQVKQSLQQEGSDPLAEDGLDAAVCHVSIADGTLTFAGARLGMMVRRDGGIEEFRGERQSIGYHSVDIGAGFANVTLPLAPGMEVWLFTDGVLDQIGGPNSTSFGRARLRRALLEPAPSLAGRGAAVLERLRGHQGRVARLDDVSLIGFRPSTFAGAAPRPESPPTNGVKVIADP